VNGLVNTDIYRRSDLKDGFSTRVNLDVHAFSGNSNYSVLSTRLRTDYFSKKNQGFLVLNGENRSNQAGRYVNNGFFHLRGMFVLPNNSVIEAFLQNEFDEFLHLKSRYLLGSGIRRLHKSSESFTAYYGLGAMLEEEIMSDLYEQSVIRISGYYSLKYLKKNRYTVSSVTYFQPRIGFFTDIRIFHQTTFNVVINSLIDFVSTIETRYDSKPRSGLKSSDFLLKQGIQIKLDFDSLKDVSFPIKPSHDDSAIDDTDIEVPIPLTPTEEKNENFLNSPG
jgi:putative salt-induced outer membrane protein YdiY